MSLWLTCVISRHFVYINFIERNVFYTHLQHIPFVYYYLYTRIDTGHELSNGCIHSWTYHFNSVTNPQNLKLRCLEAFVSTTTSPSTFRKTVV